MILMKIESRKFKEKLNGFWTCAAENLRYTQAPDKMNQYMRSDEKIQISSPIYCNEQTG